MIIWMDKNCVKWWFGNIKMMSNNDSEKWKFGYIVIWKCKH